MNPSTSTTPSRPSQPQEPQRRVEVTVTENGGGRRQVALRDMSFSEGIGWYAQKTIRLDPEQVDALLRALCCAKQGCGMRERPAAAILQLSELRDR